MKNKTLIILEVIWIVTGSACIAAAIKAASSGGRRVVIFVAMAMVSFLFAWLRHRQRKKS